MGQRASTQPREKRPKAAVTEGTEQRRPRACRQGKSPSRPRWPRQGEKRTEAHEPLRQFSEGEGPAAGGTRNVTPNPPQYKKDRETGPREAPTLQKGGGVWTAAAASKAGRRVERFKGNLDPPSKITQAQTQAAPCGESLKAAADEADAKKRRSPRQERDYAVGLKAEELPTLRVRVGRVTANALIDTGSVKSFIRPSLAGSRGAGCRNTGSGTEFRLCRRAEPDGTADGDGSPGRHWRLGRHTGPPCSRNHAGTAVRLQFLEQEWKTLGFSAD